MRSEEPKIVAIVGPTASGKTALSIELAKKHDGEVISADSTQVYKGLDIGTEKIAPEQMDGIPHHLLDVCDPLTIYTAQQFKRDSEKALSEIWERNRVPFVVGGTGYYIDALLYDIDFPEVPPNHTLRGELEKKSADELFKTLMERDPKRASTIDPKNPRRLIRALEVVEALGSVPTQDDKELRYSTLLIGIDLDTDTLRERIEGRLQDQLTRGLLSEVASLHAQGVSWERMEDFGFEYRLAGQLLRKEITPPEMNTLLINALMQYAKRQRTWFKRNRDIQWFQSHSDPNIKKVVSDFLAQKKPSGC